MRLFSKPEHLPMFIGFIFTLMGMIFLPFGVIFGIVFFSSGSLFENDMFILPLVFGLIGFVFLIIGIAFLIAGKKQKKRRLLLMETGERVLADVTDCFIDYSVRINHRHPYRLSLRYYDPFSGRTMVFTSDSVMNPNSYLGRQLTVYVDRSNPDLYYVEI